MSTSPIATPLVSDRAAQEPSNARANVFTLDRWTLVALTGIVLLAVRRWTLLGPYPPGLDGAQWIALGRGLLEPGAGRATEGAYAPLTPMLAALVESIWGPLLGLRLLAALSGILVGLAVWLVARDSVGPLWGLVVAAIVVPASALAEPMLYGGYPQQFALAFGILALWASCRYLVGAGPRWLWVAGITAVLTAAAHHVYYPLVVLSIAVANVAWVSARASARISLAPRTAATISMAKAEPTSEATPLSFGMGTPRVWSLAFALAPSLTIFAIIASAFLTAGYEAPLEASARSALEAWRYATREAPLLWLAILGIGVGGLAGSWRSRGEMAWLLAASLMLPAGLALIASGQPRLAPPVLIGAAIAAALCGRRLSAGGGVLSRVVGAVAIALAVALVIPADRAVADFARFYQVVDEPLLRAAAAMEGDAASGAVAVRADRRGWPIGWWFEALQHRPVLVGSDARWLAFPEEREYAQVAARLFDGSLSAAAFRELTAAAGVRFLVTPKWDWIGWERWLSDPRFPVAVIYDDDRYLVLRIT